MNEWSEMQLTAIALALGARHVPTLSDEEAALAKDAVKLTANAVKVIREKIIQGHDPLGEGFCQYRSAVERREKGAVYTPKKIVKAMFDWAEQRVDPRRIIDPGVGSGRFIIEAGRRFPQAELIGFEVDPLVALIARGNLAAAGLAERAKVILADYRTASLQPCDGPTLFIGNPPYVRHHQIEQKWKAWLVDNAKKFRKNVSQLAGLHIYFYMATLLNAAQGDWGSFITSAEWLDVNYGKLIRELFVDELGGRSIAVIEPTARPFPDAATTAAITTFRIGEKSHSLLLKRVEKLESLRELESGRRVCRERLEAEPRWSHFTRGPREKREGFIELGELFRVHRGQVTGFNKVWIEGPHSTLLPKSVLFPTVTRARELFQADQVLKEQTILKCVIDLPIDISVFTGAEKKAIEKFLILAKTQGADQGYVARNRKAWWSVGLREPAPILATYMARRPPAFVRNLAEARHLNIAHGLYPREGMSEEKFTAVTNFLSKYVELRDGRTYAGGLTKFEPREMERLLIPSPEMLNAYSAQTTPGVVCSGT